MAELTLSRGLFAVIDDEDLPLVEGQKFWAEKRSHTFYARSSKGYLHCQLMGDKDIDHIDRDGLNNRRKNLRKATRREQTINTRIRESKTGFRYIYPEGNKFVVRTWDGSAYQRWGTIQTIGL